MVGSRAGHRHKKNQQALICIAGSCEIYTHDGKKEKTFIMDSSDKCLILDPVDWHRIDAPSKNAILISFSSHEYDLNDYIDDPYS